jgi:hypothetical protein
LFHLLTIGAIVFVAASTASVNGSAQAVPAAQGGQALPSSRRDDIRVKGHADASLDDRLPGR